jgi:ABC-type sugar transport system permease subunit
MAVFLFVIMGAFSVVQFIVGREKNDDEPQLLLAVLALSIPAFLWLVPTIWMVSLSFQPNEVLARTTSTTAFGLIPCRSRRELRRALQPSDRRRCGS